ncbi:TetR/AcrR family transcriptional regulator [Cognatiyoonia sp. IB215446]|uniref:TetR/AcrR family transcriptional regulator n=1 Tax=Cognatiyoonia sp. IB215446 TaxID=3097355 RepID=UPI002A153D1B|nr:TetR/AcrR family transcriptional regulator [Cognatiyoonia sp. IB215446]MDX8346741.1 TetR/AcrR family transcriptional regulator [Cognatiyoonia sp. IB215446]
MSTDKLTPTDWLDCALQELTTQGYGALKAQPLAKKLNVTRGSFYYHFESLVDFHAAVIRHWSAKTTSPLIADLAAHATPQETLRALLSITLKSGEQLERAMRSWATVNAQVAAGVKDVDDTRIAYAEELLRACGVAPRDAVPRAKLLYWAAIGRLMMPFPDDSHLSEDEIAGIAALMGESANLGDVRNAT